MCLWVVMALSLALNRGAHMIPCCPSMKSPRLYAPFCGIYNHGLSWQATKKPRKEKAVGKAPRLWSASPRGQSKRTGESRDQGKGEKSLKLAGYIWSPLAILAKGCISNEYLLFSPKRW